VQEELTFLHCGNLNAETESTPQERKSYITLAREEVDLVDACKGESIASLHKKRRRKVLSNHGKNTKPTNKVGVLTDSCEIKPGRKKMKVSCFMTIHFSTMFLLF